MTDSPDKYVKKASGWKLVLLSICFLCSEHFTAAQGAFVADSLGSRGNAVVDTLTKDTLRRNAPSPAAGRPAEIKILHADHLKPGIRDNLNILRGNVRMRHKDVLISCDSLYHYRDSNYIESYGNVHVVQHDTLNLWGDFMTYSGNTRKAKVRKNVVMQNPQITLKTNFLDYNMEEEVGHYFNGGTLKDSINTLISDLGYYYVKRNTLFFKDSVKVYSPDYTMYSDTMTYHTESKIITISGPTHIYGDSRYLYSEQGWYNSVTSHVEVYKNNRMVYSEYSGWADTIIIDSMDNTAFMMGSIRLLDTVNNVIVEGEYGEVVKDNDYSFVTHRAMMTLVGQQDSLFIHGDTLSVSKDTAGNNLLKAYYNTKFYNTDLQGICDSMTFNVADSTIYLNGSPTPIVWGSGNQMTAQYIDMVMANNTVKEFHLNDKAMLINQFDTANFNQMKGREMTGYVKDNELHLIDVNGNGESIYFYDEKGEILMFKTTSSFIKIFIQNRAIKDVFFITDAEGDAYPLFKLQPEEKLLRDYIWHIEKKPQKKEDIFKKTVVPATESE